MSLSKPHTDEMYVHMLMCIDQRILQYYTQQSRNLYNFMSMMKSVTIAAKACC